MLIPIEAGGGTSATSNQWSIVELQGELETKDGSTAISNCDVGQVCFKKVSCGLLGLAIHDSR